MKNIRHIKIFTLIGLLLLIALQTFWILNVYHLMEKELDTQINTCFNIAIKKELNTRMSSPSIKTAKEYNKGVIYDSGIEGIGHEINFEKDISVIMQDYLSHSAKFTSLNDLDSILHAVTVAHHILGTFKPGKYWKPPTQTKRANYEAQWHLKLSP